jgi:hypothetical protein
VVGSGAVVVSRSVVVVVVLSGRPGRRGHGFRIHTTRQPRHESLDAPAVVHRPLYEDACNVPSVRSKRDWEDYRSHSPPRSSIPVWYRTRRPLPTNPARTRPCTRTLPPKGSTAHGAPDGVHPSGFSKPDQQTHSQPRAHYVAVALMCGQRRTASGHSAGDALRALRREVGGRGMIHRPPGCTIRSKREWVHPCRR